MKAPSVEPRGKSLLEVESVVSLLEVEAKLEASLLEPKAGALLLEQEAPLFELDAHLLWPRCILLEKETEALL
jgi:hypothetical protein